MMTEVLDWFDERVARGSIVRFGMAGGFNSTVFYLLWILLLEMSSSINIEILWGVCWGTTSVFAHFVHRWFTFDDRKPLSWTLPTAIPVYLTSLLGSSLTIGWLTNIHPEDVRILGVFNLLAWGVIIWLMMRFWVFQYADEEQNTTSTERAFPRHQEE